MEYKDLERYANFEHDIELKMYPTATETVLKINLKNRPSEVSALMFKDYVKMTEEEFTAWLMELYRGEE